MSKTVLDSIVRAQTKSVAQILLDEYIEDIMRYYDGIKEPKSFEEATALALNNIGYYAGYYDQETRERVERLLGAIHPVLGSAVGKQLTNEQIFKIGQEYGARVGKSWEVKSSPTLDEIRMNELTRRVVESLDGEDEQ